jgi:RNA polymerase sigma-70 factor, ECF subfamily
MRNNLERGETRGVQPNDTEYPGTLATFEKYRGLLFSIAYLMLGSVADAEYIQQETFIRWQRTSSDEIRSPRALLVTIVTRLCINHLESARVRREQYVGGWLPEPLVTDPKSDPSHVLRVDDHFPWPSLVFLERLTSIERTVFLLREIFEYEYSEIATILGQSEANCRQILRRARQHVSQARPRFRASSEERSRLLERFLRATSQGDMDALVDLLASDVVLHSDGGGKALAVPNLIYGADKVARGILGSLERLVPRNLLTRTALINGQPGIVSYLNGKPYSVLTLDTREGRIRAIYVLTNPEKLAHLPELPTVPCYGCWILIFSGEPRRGSMSRGIHIC